jgi:hypothetical protein
MRHPFDGIIAADSAHSKPQASRRSLLRWLLSSVGSLAALMMGGWRPALAADSARQGDPKNDPEKKRAKGYRLYLVVPHYVQTFGSARRAELGVTGRYVAGWKGNRDLLRSKGYLAWVTPEEAKAISAAEDITTVHELKADDTITVGVPAFGPTELIVSLNPNGWRQKPDAGTYLTSEELAQMWSRQYARFANLEFFPSAKGATVYVWIKSGALPDEVLAALKADPQVTQLLYSGKYTTLAFSEEGGVTPPTTRVVAEEGATTLALGEEGGVRPGPTTRALGEEGGIRPPRLPTPGVPTTLAVGEEGGRTR